MFIEATTMPPAICEMRVDFNDPIVAPCRVVVDVNLGFSTVLFNIADTPIVITGENMSGGRIKAERVKAGDLPRLNADGECEIKSKELKITCKFALDDTQFYLEARF